MQTNLEIVSLESEWFSFPLAAAEAVYWIGDFINFLLLILIFCRCVRHNYFFCRDV